MSWSNILERTYWFALFTPPLSKVALIGGLSCATIMFVGALFLRLSSRRKKSADPPLAQGLRHLSRPLFFFSLLTYFLIAARQFEAAILSARAGLALVGLLTIFWLVSVLRKFLRTYPEARARLEVKRKNLSYLKG